MLNEILTTDIYRLFLIFSRVGAAMMIMPGFGSSVVQARVRLLLAVAVAFLLLPVLRSTIPPLPSHPSTLFLLIAGEVTVGVYLGVMTQVLVSSLQVAGTFIGFQTGLTNAFSFDAVAQQQSTLLSGFLSNLALVALFATDMHHVMIHAIVDSYDLFRPGQPMPFGDFSETLAHMTSDSFTLGVRMAAPLLVFGLVFYAGLGLLSRLVPQMQVFFVAQPMQVLGGLWMLMVALPLIMLLFLHAFEDGLAPYLTPPLAPK